MKEQIKQLIEELNHRQRNFSELYIYDRNEFWKGRVDEAEVISEKLREIIIEYEEAKTFDSDLSELPEAI